ncbi:MAG: S9 family peptidase [Chitinophagaceae bacterium]|nr:S9 family peptidase [Oligoflexus sp.]
MKVPLAPKRNESPVSPLHLQDEWHWLENIEDPETSAYLKAENAYYKHAMKSQASLQKTVLAELKERLAENDSSVPERDGDYWYYIRFKKGQQYPLYCRKKLTLEAPEEIYFDHNAIAKKHSYCDLGFLDVSPNHNLLAYSVDLEGNERYRIVLRDLSTGKETDLKIDGISTCFEWKNDTSFFYIKLDDNDRPLDVYFRELSKKESQLVYTEKDTSYFLALDSSESEDYIFLGCNGYDANEVWYHKISDPEPTFHCFLSRKAEHEYELTHHDKHFLIISNYQAVNYQIFKTPVDKIDIANWQPIQPYDETVLIENLSVFRDFWIISERYKALPRLKIIPLIGETEPFWIDIPEEAYELSVSDGGEFTSDTFRFWYSSPRIPQSLYEFHVPTQNKTFLKRRSIGAKPYREDDYIVKRVWAPSRDGLLIPVTLLYHKDTKAPAPVVLHSYGSYGETLDCDFSNYRMALVDRGYIYAMAHIRGGMEMGRTWYLDGKLDRKWNTFHDYIDSAEYLIREGWTKTGQIVAEGSSAGGMLMGVVANERPELFLGIVASVPFVDVLNTMLDPELPLTTLEYKEWGNPNNPEDYERIKSYSPYDNVKAQAYPHMLVVAGLHDQRVLYWEAAKWVARLRDRKTNDKILLLKIEDESGHSGASGRYDSLRETAEELTFIIMLKDLIPT